MSKSNVAEVSGCGCFLLVIAIQVAIGSFAWPYTINTWLEFLGKEPALVWWQGALMGFVPYLGGLSIPLAVMTWLLMMFIVGG